MKQTRITRYYARTWERHPGPNFLDFPVDIRERIYTLVGIPQGCRFEMNGFQQDGGYVAAEYYDSDDSNANDRESHVSLGVPTAKPKYRAAGGSVGNLEHFFLDVEEPCQQRLPFELFYVSRQVSREASRLFYSRNSFAIFLPLDYFASTKSILHRFRAETLAAMTCLTVRVNSESHCTSSEKGIYCSCSVRGCKCWDHWAAYRSNVIGGCSTFPLWDPLIVLLKRHIMPHRLKLAVIFDTDKLELARKISDPILELPPLKHCAIRFCPRSLQVPSLPLHDLRALAETTAQLATRGWTVNQNSVLSQEMPPTAHVATTEWRKKLNSIVPREIPHELFFRILEYTDLVSQNPLEWTLGAGFNTFRPDSRVENTCPTCLSVVESSCDPETLRLKGGVGYSCDCWKFPIDIFLLSRDIRQEALRIFFSKNHFLLLPRGGRAWPRGDCDIPCRELVDAEFPTLIPRMPRSAIKHLRSIQFVIPQYSYFCEPDSRSVQGIVETTRLLGSYALTSELTITLDMATDRSRPYGNLSPEVGIDICKKATVSTSQKVWPFTNLKGLKDFFVHLSEPEYVITPEQDRSSLESEMERWVMGKNYDAIAKGKYLRWHQAPQWWKIVNRR